MIAIASKFYYPNIKIMQLINVVFSIIYVLLIDQFIVKCSL